MVYNIGENIATPRVRSILSQCIAITSPSLLLLDIGMAVSFPTIALPDMLNSKTDVSLDDVQASWFGSLPFLTQPFGAMLSGLVVDYFGRKKASFIVNIPHILGWILMYFAPNTASVFIANILLGFGTGIMEAPICAYVAEVSEPSLRGALSLSSQCLYGLGVLAMYFLGLVVYWRQAALISLAAPVTAMILTLFVPETPIWLLSQGRPGDAMKSLQILRGWTTEDKVKEEFDQLVMYSNDLQRCVICSEDDDDKSNKDSTNYKHTSECLQLNPIKRCYKKFKMVMLCKETLWPLSFMLIYFLCIEMSGFTPIRPNMVNLCGAFGMADDGKNVTFMVGLISFFTSVIAVFIIKATGKRKMGILTMLGSALCCVALSVYAKMYITDSVFSYDPTTFPSETSYWPVVYFYALAVFSGCNVPWVMLGEVFHFRSRATAQGFATALDYIIIFLGAKTLITFETGFHLWGTFAVYAVFGLVGTLFLYFFMPETEGVSLTDIEKYYNGPFRIFADDRFINMFRRNKSEKQFVEKNTQETL